MLNVMGLLDACVRLCFGFEGCKLGFNIILVVWRHVLVKHGDVITERWHRQGGVQGMGAGR